MLFKEGEVKGNVKTLTQNRYGSLSKINEDTPILHFDMWPGIRCLLVTNVFLSSFFFVHSCLILGRIGHIYA